MATIDKYQTSSGETRYRVRYRKPTGKQTDKRGFRRKADADAFAATVEVSKLKGEFVEAKVGRTTVGVLGSEWLKRQGHLKPATIQSYETKWRVHVEPRWGSVRLVDIRHTDVQAWVSELAARRPGTVDIAYHVLCRILADAVTDRKIAFNPARGAKMPPRPPRRKPYLTAQQLQMLVDESGQYRSLVLLLGLVGLRWGEAIPLRVADVDFLRRRVHLTRNAVRLNRGFHVGTLKTNQDRTVVLPQVVVDALAQTADGKGREDLLWPPPHGRYLLSRWLKGAVARCRQADPEFPHISPHSLRHTAASLAISAGANPKVVQRMLGHKSAAMTLDIYADLFESDQDAVAENVGKMWAREIR